MDGRRLAGCAVALGVMAGACSSSTTAGPPEASRAAQVNAFDDEVPLSRSHEGPAVVVDKDDPNIVYLAHVELITGECRFAVSVDRGATWRQENAPELLPFTRNCAMGAALPQNLRNELQQGPNGDLYWVFQANAPDRNGTRSVMLGRTSDGGRSWTTTAIDPGAPAPEPGVQMEVNFQGHLAIDPADPERLVAMWRRSFRNYPESLPTRPYMATSTDGGATWSAPQRMFEKNNGFDGPYPVIAGDSLYAFYRESAPPAPGADQPPLPEPPTTKLFVAISNDGGRTWAQDVEIARARDASEPMPLYDRTRNMFHVVWHDNRAEELDIYYSSSTDATTWTTPKLLNDDTRGTRVGQHYPRISMSPDGRIDVAWYDWRDDPFPPPTVGTGQILSLFSNRGTMSSVYMTSSRDGGETWTPNLKVNDLPIDRTIGTWKNNIDVLSPVAISSDNRGAVVAWSDTRNGNAISQAQDVFTSTVSFGTTEPRRVTALQAGLAGGLFGLGIAMCLAVFLFRRQNPAPETKPARQEQPVG
ncbi:MAG: sialidase family protein [Actinomycetota bacterium]